jgi:hypothetical protein
MGEVVAWALGLVLGLVYPRPLRSFVRAIPFVILTAALGTGITVLAGEWAQEPDFALVDVGQVALAAAIGAFARAQIRTKWKMIPANSKAR